MYLKKKRRKLEKVHEKTFQTLDQGQRRIIISNRKETNLVSHIIAQTFRPEALSRPRWREVVPKESTTHSLGWGDWNRCLGRPRPLEFAGRSTTEEGAVHRKSSTHLYRDIVDSWRLTYLCVIRQRQTTREMEAEQFSELPQDSGFNQWGWEELEQPWGTVRQQAHLMDEYVER